MQALLFLGGICRLQRDTLDPSSAVDLPLVDGNEQRFPPAQQYERVCHETRRGKDPTGPRHLASDFVEQPEAFWSNEDRDLPAPVLPVLRRTVLVARLDIFECRIKAVCRRIGAIKRQVKGVACALRRIGRGPGDPCLIRELMDWIIVIEVYGVLSAVDVVIDRSGNVCIVSLHANRYLRVLFFGFGCTQELAINVTLSSAWRDIADSSEQISARGNGAPLSLVVTL